MIAGLTSLKELSASLAKKGIAATVRGTIAAVVPRDVPMISRVRGMRAIIKMAKGKERVILTSKPTKRFKKGRGVTPSLEVKTKKRLKGSPHIRARSPLVKTM